MVGRSLSAMARALSLHPSRPRDWNATARRTQGARRHRHGHDRPRPAHDRPRGRTPQPGGEE